MNGSKLLLIGVLVGFGGGMVAAVGIKLLQGRGAGGIAAATPVAGDAETPALGSAGAAETPPTPVAGTSGLEAPLDPAPPDSTVPADPATANAAPRTTKGKATSGTRVSALSKSSMRDASNELPVEGPPAKIVFAKPAADGTALTRITEVRAGDNSTVRMELTGRARWKILELPKRHEVWIDFEEVEIPGGEKAASGSKIHVDSIRAKSFDEGAIARVVIKLAHEGKFSVSVSDGFAATVSTKGKGRTGEADGMLEVSFMGAVGGDLATDLAGDPWATQ